MNFEPPTFSDSVPEMDADVLAKLGITLVRTEQYHVGPYRYGRLAESIAGTERRAPGNCA